MGNYMWYKKDYRRIFMDMHLNDSNPEYLSKLDTDNFVKNLVDANVSSVVVKAKSHVGLHYWPSDSGKMHNTLKNRNLDYVGEMIDKCHKNGINVIVYYSQVYDNYAYDNHKGMRMKYYGGFASSRGPFKKFGRYGIVCPNNPKYKEYCKTILTELATKYNYEGMFMDMPFWPNVCFCRHCRARYLKETGKMLPIIMSPSNKNFRDFVHARQRWINEFIQQNTQVVKSVNENISMEHNMAAIGLNWIQGNTEENFLHSDYAGGDYYGGYLEQSFMCKYYNNVTKNKPFCYITSRCDRNLFFHTVSRTMQDLLIHCMTALVHTGAFSICDAMNPDGTITEKMYQGPIKEVFEISQHYEQYVSGDIISDVAIWYNTNFKVNKNFIQSNFDIANALRKHHIAYDVIGSKNISTTKAKVIVMCDIQEITDKEFEDLKNYVQNGGSLFITGSLNGHKDLQQLVGVKVEGMSKYRYSYLVPTEGNEHLMEDFDKSSPYPVEQSSYETKIVDDNVQTIATLSYPYTLPNSTDFAAIHSNPPGIHTTLAGITKKNYGKGNIMWVANNFQSTPATNCKSSVCKLITSMAGELQFTAEAPEYVEVLMWEKDNDTYLSIINQQTTTPVYPVDNIQITINGIYTKASIVGNESKDIKIDIVDNSTIINVPSLEVFYIIKLVCKEAK